MISALKGASAELPRRPSRVACTGAAAGAGGRGGADVAALSGLPPHAKKVARNVSQGSFGCVPLHFNLSQSLQTHTSGHLRVASRAMSSRARRRRSRTSASCASCRPRPFPPPRRIAAGGACRAPPTRATRFSRAADALADPSGDQGLAATSSRISSRSGGMLSRAHRSEPHGGLRRHADRDPAADHLGQLLGEPGRHLGRVGVDHVAPIVALDRRSGRR